MSLSGWGITTNLWPADRCHLLTCISRVAVSLRLGMTIRHLSGRCWKGFHGHGVKGQGLAATVMEVCGLESSWKTEWIWTKTCTNTYCTWETNWLGSQGDGFKGQGHRNVCWRRIAVEGLVKVHFVAQILGKEKCVRFANDSRFRQGPSNDCYVAFPRRSQGAPRSWYDARRNCWYFGGDLAPSRAVLNITSSSWPGRGNDNFFVGLQRDEYVWDNNRGTCYRHFNSLFRVTATCWLYFCKLQCNHF